MDEVLKHQWRTKRQRAAEHGQVSKVESQQAGDSRKKPRRTPGFPDVLPDEPPRRAAMEDPVDSLDVFMKDLVLPPPSAVAAAADGSNSSDSDSEIDNEDQEVAANKRLSKLEKMEKVDHENVSYARFKKCFYIEHKEIAQMTEHEVTRYREEHELKVHAKKNNVPKPIKTWTQAGLTSSILKVIKRAGYKGPLPIQAQALPVIMSGRDCIGVAKTGSGKALAFVLPMLRHVLNQPKLGPEEGPIALVMAPTRELVQQIYWEIQKFAKALGSLRCVPVYGGSGVQQQIRLLKKGAEVVVCTPGRMVDLLCTSGGKVTNLRRVTYLVLDEADRMFDLGFEPQISKIIGNINPDRQMVLFSATFPTHVEVLARKVLHAPVHICTGGRNLVNKDIVQIVELRVEDDRFRRLLELLGEWSSARGKILIFVNSQQKCDSLFQELLRMGHLCSSLHGGKDQSDRESTISDFKSNVISILVATSVAARGLDVHDLELVINYEVPHHYEEYVHRVGRTGRAGQKGLAITFICQGEEMYAPDLVKALESSNQVVPEDLRQMAHKAPKASTGHGNGYGGRGHKFSLEEEQAHAAAKKAQANGFEMDDDEENEKDHEVSVEAGSRKAEVKAAMDKFQEKFKAMSATKASADPLEGLGGRTVVEINDLRQETRYQLTRKEVVERISEECNVAISVRGKFVAANEEKLYLLIQGDSDVAVARARASIKMEFGI